MPPPPYQYWDDSPAWSNSGNKIAFFSKGIKQVIEQRGIYIIDTVTSEKYLVEEVNFLLPVSPAWLQGDSEIVYSDHGIYKTNINSKEKQLLIGIDVDIVTAFDITLDGRRIYYDIPGEGTECDRLILCQNLETGRIDTLTCGYYPSLSPNNELLVFCLGGFINLYNLANDSIIQLNLKGEYLDWSPAGDLITYQYRQPQQSRPDIYATDLYGNSYKITEQGSKPRFSPDGNKIIYVRISSDVLRHLWVVNTDGSDNIQITF